MEQINNIMIQLLDTLQPKTRNFKSSRNTSVQPKASQSAPLEVKASGSKEVPIALESDVEEINPMREGETKPRRLSTEKPDPPKEEERPSQLPQQQLLRLQQLRQLQRVRCTAEGQKEGLQEV
ncbi:hypothetical protein DL768_009229 [Monosporascus sp. mg162]|nr:hypothetical protein DL768_009229 [Monosporascus sp. mg162]